MSASVTIDISFESMLVNWFNAVITSARDKRSKDSTKRYEPALTAPLSIADMNKPNLPVAALVLLKADTPKSVN